jgi:hypothetical protein
MVIKATTTPHFKIFLELQINWELESVEILTILEDIKQLRRRTETFKGDELSKALKQYETWEMIITEE